MIQRESRTGGTALSERRHPGGAVTITATVNAAAGVGQVRATVGAAEVPLALVGAQHEGVFEAPSNAGATASTYTATDTEGRASAAFAAGTLTVRAAERPHEPPDGW